ncbi:MAG TPA: hypothetical protein VGT07_08825 [Steroidobacteraceae bacterium]|nr:hypothetical protein [Steroidobacteraceae bacterium]
MSAPKPHIKPKADPYRCRNELPKRDLPPFAEIDPPIFSERDGEREQNADDRVLFHEDDCLR